VFIEDLKTPEKEVFIIHLDKKSTENHAMGLQKYTLNACMVWLIKILNIDMRVFENIRGLQERHLKFLY